MRALTNVFAAVSVLALAALPAAAQDASIGPAPTKSHWLVQIIAIFLALCLVVAAFMSSRRTHQD